jgi:serine/threonine protein kinase
MKDITDDSKIKRIYDATKTRDWRPKIKREITKGAEVIRDINDNWQMVELCKDKVYKITRNEQVYVLKKLVPDEYDDLMVENICEMVVNVILTCKAKDIVVPIRNIVIKKHKLYMIFDYHRGGTVWDNDKVRTDPATSFAVLKSVCETMDKMHKIHGITHFDTKVDNIFLDLSYVWADTDTESSAQSVDFENAGNELVVDVKFGDFGLCEFTLHDKRVVNTQIPRERKYVKQWGRFPVGQSVSYDYLLFFSTFDSHVKRSKFKFMDTLWKELASEIAGFSPKIFNNEGRSSKIYTFTYEDVARVLDRVKQIHQF